MGRVMSKSQTISQTFRYSTLTSTCSWIYSK